MISLARRVWEWSAPDLRDASGFGRIIEARKRVVAAEHELREAVVLARASGDSWTVIGAAMGTTKQAAFQRVAGDVGWAWVAEL